MLVFKPRSLAEHCDTFSPHNKTQLTFESTNELNISLPFVSFMIAGALVKETQLSYNDILYCRPIYS